MIDTIHYSHIADFFKVVSDETRVKIIYSIAQEELNVNAIAQQLHMTQSAISHQLKLLKDTGFVKSRKVGKHIYYSLDDDHVVDLLHTVKIHVDHKLKEQQ